MTTTQIFLPDINATDRLGICLAKAARTHKHLILQQGLNIRLEGNLGAGKTATVRSFLRALGVTGRINSPTFTLLETYPLESDLEAYHFDFYRFETPEEFIEAGFRENFAPGHITLVEWSEKAMPCLPQPDLTLTLSVQGDGRSLLLESHTEIGQSILNEVISAWH